jgi:hypothetical protein
VPNCTLQIQGFQPNSSNVIHPILSRILYIICQHVFLCFYLYILVLCQALMSCPSSISNTSGHSFKCVYNGIQHGYLKHQLSDLQNAHINSGNWLELATSITILNSCMSDWGCNQNMKKCSKWRFHTQFSMAQFAHSFGSRVNFSQFNISVKYFELGLYTPLRRFSFVFC